VIPNSVEGRWSMLCRLDLISGVIFIGAIGNRGRFSMSRQLVVYRG
jgi:hypothetical protein